MLTLTPQNGGNDLTLDDDKNAKLCIEMYWEVVVELSIDANPNPLTLHWTPKLGISKLAL